MYYDKLSLIISAWLGCYNIAGQTLYLALDSDTRPNTLYQCVEACKASQYQYLAITGNYIIVMFTNNEKWVLMWCKISAQFDCKQKSIFFSKQVA